jgi:competence protein ComEC
MSFINYPPQPFQAGQNSLLLFFLAYASGILIAPFFLPIADKYLLPVFFIFFILTFFQKVRGYLLILFIAFFGFTYYHLNMAAPEEPQHISHFGGSKRTIEGYVNDLSMKPVGSVLDLDVTHIVSPNTSTRIKGKILLFVREGCPDVEPGDKIRVVAKLRRPFRYGTPGEFNYPRHLARNRVYVTATTPTAIGVVRLGDTKRRGWRDSIEILRHKIRLVINDSIAPEIAPFLRALTIGDRRGLSLEQRNLLGRSGVSHLFAISGLHMGILFFFFYVFLKYAYTRSKKLLLLAPPRQVLPLLITPLLLFYLLLAGGSPPTQRAFLALAFASVLVGLCYYSSPIRIVLAVAFLILLFDPLALFTPSYQLSFAAVFAILFMAPRWQKRIQHLPLYFKYPANLFFITVTATLATLPLVLFHFHIFSPASLLINLIAVPLVTIFALPSALLGIALFLPFPALGQLLFQFSALILDLTLKIIRILTTVFDSHSGFYYLTPWEIIGFPLLLFTLLFNKKLPFGNWRSSTAICVFTGLLIFYPFTPRDTFSLTAMNVGHGDSLLVCKNTKNYLVDGGGSYSNDFDVGEKIVAPALGWLGVKKFDAVILTHAHPDHFKGLPFILKHFEVKEFWSAIPFDNLPAIIQKPLKQNNIPVITFPEGWTLFDEGPDSVLSVYVPPQSTTVINDRSMVLFMRDENNRLLLTGDLEKRGVENFIRSSLYSKTGLLKLPHHGSRHSTPELLVNFFRPEIAFATTNRKLTEKDFSVFSTNTLNSLPLSLNQNGEPASLRFIATKDGWEVRYWQRGLFR